MLEETPAEMQSRLASALDIIPTREAAERIRSHLLWEADGILSHLRLSDLTDPELMGLIALLVPAHSRVLGPENVPHPPTLTLIR